MGCKLIQPDIVKQLREEEKQGLLKNKEKHSNNETKNDLEKLKDIEFILELQKGVIIEFLSKIKQGKIKTNQFVVLSLNELLNYYNSEYWRIISNKTSIDKHILSFFHLVNTYIEHLEQSSKSKETSIDKDKNYNEIMKLKNMILTLTNVIR